MKTALSLMLPLITTTALDQAAARADAAAGAGRRMAAHCGPSPGAADGSRRLRSGRRG